MSKATTVRELIHRTEKQFTQADLFYGHGTDNALDEAFYLVMAAARLDFNCDEEALDNSLQQDQLEHINSLIDKRINQRIPVAYLVNQAWFAGHQFYVDERVLIPRSPIAELITSKFIPWVDPKKVKRILDLGTGCACIPIACAYAFPDAEADAAEIDNDAIAVARKNIELHQLEERVHLYKSDLFDHLPEHKYDLIISNPPYVVSDEMQSLPQEYRYEPGHALEANNNGLELVEQIINQASAYLNDSGVIVVEVGNSMEALIERYPNLPFTWLEFEQGGEGVFLLNKVDLEELEY